MNSKPFTQEEEARLRSLIAASYLGSKMTPEEHRFVHDMFRQNEGRYSELSDEVRHSGAKELRGMMTKSSHGLGIPTLCKIGTIPALVYVDVRQEIKVGSRIQVRETGHGMPWFEVAVDKINENGYFFASR